MSTTSTEPIQVFPCAVAAGLLLRLRAPLFDALLRANDVQAGAVAYRHWETFGKIAAKILSSGFALSIHEYHSLCDAICFAHKLHFHPDGLRLGFKQWGQCGCEIDSIAAAFYELIEKEARH